MIKTRMENEYNPRMLALPAGISLFLFILW